MKPLRVASAAMVVLALAAVASSQRGMRQYDLATETTLTGTVNNVATMASPGRGGGGLHLTLATSSGEFEIRVGPAWFVSSRHVTFAKGDTVTVTGSKVTTNGREVIIAREIRRGEELLTLRDASGVPLWARRGGTQ